MGNFSKGFLIFALATLIVSVLVVILSLFVFENKEDLQPLASISFEKRNAVKVETEIPRQDNAATNSSSSQEDKLPVPKKELSADANAGISDTDIGLISTTGVADIEKQKEESFETDNTQLLSSFDQEEEVRAEVIMPAKSMKSPEEEMAKEFDVTIIPENIPEPLEVMEPRSDLVEKRGATYLPKISKEGDEPWKVYARPISEEVKGKPKVAVVIYGLGLKTDYTDLAITKLPPDVTLSFSAYADRLEEKVKKARNFGHEVMIDLPLEDRNFPIVDGGPNTILKTASLVQNEQKIKSVLKNAGAFSGVTALGGGGLLENKEVLNLVYGAIFDRGLLFLETEQKALFPQRYKDKGAYIKTNMFIEDNFFDDALQKVWEDIENKAQKTGMAVVVFPMNPAVFDSIINWFKKNKSDGEQKIVPSPLTALVRTNNAK